MVYSFRDRVLGPAVWAQFLKPEVVAWFTKGGWTAGHWWALDQELAAIMHAFPNAGSDIDRRTFNMRGWLRNPPFEFAGTVSPRTVRETLTRYGELWAPDVLDGFADGASTRFMAAYLAAYLGGDDDDPARAAFPGGIPGRISAPHVTWGNAKRAGLSEPAAVGWVLTGLLFGDCTVSPLGRLDEDEVGRRLLPWNDRFGPTAYLWVLAGFTFPEATALRKANTVSDEQLRVMAALNGVTLPAGV